MKCPRCQHENRPGAKFCDECGTPFKRTHESGPPLASYADLQHVLSEALEQQAATSEILRVISQSTTDVQPVLDVVAENAARVCGASDAIIFRAEGDHLRRVAHFLSVPVLETPELRRIDRESLGGRVVIERISIQIADISDEMAAQEALRARERLLHRLAEALPLGVFQVDHDARVVYANERLGEIVGVPPCGTVRDQLGSVSADDWPSLDEALRGVLVDGRDATLEVRLRRPASDELRFSRIVLRSLTDDDGEVRGAIVCVEDVTESVRLRGELEHRATYDVLTRCHNRASIMTALETALARSATSTTGVAFLDVDGFKSVNDSLGHAAGDELLVVVADRLRAAVRSRDIVGRLGGDEFLVVCPDVGDPAEAVELAQRVRDSLRGTVTVANTELELRVSVGVAWSGADDATAELLVARADAIMYESKHRRGR